MEERAQVLVAADFAEPGFHRELRAGSVSLGERAHAPGKVESEDARLGPEARARSDGRDPVERGGQVGALELERAAPALPDAKTERGIGHERVRGSEAAQEAERLLVEGGQHVLAVVLDLARLRLGPGIGPPARALTRFENEDARAARCERGGRGDSCEPGPDDDRVEGSAHRSAWAARIELPAIQARSWNGTRISRRNTS